MIKKTIEKISMIGSFKPKGGRYMKQPHFYFLGIIMSLSLANADATHQQSSQILNSLNNPLYENILGKKRVKNFIQEFNASQLENKKRAYLFYFFSESVPKNSLFDFLVSVDKIKSVAPELQTVQYLRGFTSNFKNYLMDLQQGDAVQTNERVHRGLKIKLHPRRFEELAITQVPAIVYAECYNNYYSECDIKYIVRGDIDTAEAMRLFSQKDENFKSWEKAIFEIDQ